VGHAPTRALGRIGLRGLARHPWQTVLMVIGIMLGVAVMVAIDLANAAAGRAFDLSTEAVAGRATHQIVGGPAGLDEAVYRRLRVEAGVRPAAPILAAYVTSPQLGNRPIQLLGVDPFAEGPFRSYLPADNAGSATGFGAELAPGQADPTGQLVAFLTQPAALLISEELAREHGLAAGDQITLNINGRLLAGRLAGLLAGADALSRRALDGLILADIATVQELTGRLGRLDHIDLILRDEDREGLRSLRDLLPPDVQIVPVAARSGAIAQMTAAFRINLTALSLLALVVGMFLIYNSMTFSVVQRRPIFGTLRCLGVTRGEIAGLVLIEALAVGLIGSALGLALGLILGQAAVRLVTQTINDLYFVVTVRGVVIAPESLVKGALIGIAATTISAALPVWEAASSPPRLALVRSGIEERARRAVPLTALAAAISLALGGLLLAVPPQALAGLSPLARGDGAPSGPALSLTVSFAGIFFVTIACALLAPAATLVAMRGVAPLTARIFGVLGRLAPRSVAAALSRTAVAVAALMVAVSVTIGVGLMIASFRTTVVAWLGQTLWGDIYISAPGLTATRAAAPLDPQIETLARNWPGVVRADVLRSTDVASPAGRIAIAAVSDRDLTAPRIFVATDGGRAAAAEAVRRGAVLASEPLANRLGLAARGATITLYTDRGPHAFPVAGIYRDYSSSDGVVMMTRELYRRFWDDAAITAVAIKLAPGSDLAATVAALETRLAELPAGGGALVRPNAALRGEALAVFDRAFAITAALQLLAALVAFVGVLSALLSLQLERGRELGLLRAVGLTVGQLRGAVLLETGLMGTVAGLLAMPTGLALALVLIYIINRRSFGWTLELYAEPGVFIQAMLLAVAAALLAGVYPAIRMGRMLAAEALRGD
jgi:putative ABC transport system permease protein